MNRVCPLCAGASTVPAEAETRAWRETRWRFRKTGLTQTALVADVDLDEYERVQRDAGRWFGPWETL